MNCQQKAEDSLIKLLARNHWPEDDNLYRREVTPRQAQRLLERIATIRLYAHTYSFFFNLQYGLMSPMDLLQQAYSHNLAGCALHVHDGGTNSLSSMTNIERQDFGQLAAELDLALSVETSHTDKAHIDEAVAVALGVGAPEIRVYSRYEGRLSHVLNRITKDLGYITELAERNNLYFLYEQHEDLKSAEIVNLITQAECTRIGVLFDFCNMINANEPPLKALRTMAPLIRQVHVKGGRRFASKNGWGQEGVLFHGPSDEMPGERLLYELLLLGEEQAQITAFILEQEVGYVSPAFRGPGEDDPYIPYREPSETVLPKDLSIEKVCQEERYQFQDMLRRVHEALATLQNAAQTFLLEHPGKKDVQR